MSRRGAIVVVAGIVAVSLLAVRGLMQGAAGKAFLAERFPLRRLVVTGEFSHLTAAGIRDRMAPLVGGGFFLTDVGRLRESLLSEPWVDEVEIRRRWPDVLVVSVRERRAVARAHGGGLVDTRGRLFFPFGADADALSILPELDMPAHDGRLDVGLLARLQERLRPTGRRLAFVRVDRRRALRLGLVGGPELRLGREDREARLARFVRFHERLQAVVGGDLKVVDLRYDNGLAVVRSGNGKG